MHSRVPLAARRHHRSSNFSLEYNAESNAALRAGARRVLLLHGKRARELMTVANSSGNNKKTKKSDERKSSQPREREHEFSLSTSAT